MRPLFPAIVTAALVIYAFFRRALTTTGIGAAVVTAAATAFHPWGVFFSLLVSFFFCGTLVTKLAHNRKAALLAPSQNPAAAKAEPRNALQVFCNSLPMALMTAGHGLYMHFRLSAAPGFLISMPPGSADDPFWFPPVCLSRPTSSEVGLNPYMGRPDFHITVMNTFPYAIMAGYAAVAADTFASEIGMLAGSKPFLVTSLLRGRVERVPHGTNGGITIEGVLASAVGAALMALTALYTIPFCEGTGSLNIVETRAAYLGVFLAEGVGDLKRWGADDRTWFVVYMTAAGIVGALLDSVIGAMYQASFVDSKSGLVVEGEGGRKLKQAVKGSRKLVTGADKLSNNAVNLIMAASVCAASVGVMLVVTA